MDCGIFFKQVLGPRFTIVPLEILKKNKVKLIQKYIRAKYCNKSINLHKGIVIEY